MRAADDARLNTAWATAQHSVQQALKLARTARHNTAGADIVRLEMALSALESRPEPTKQMTVVHGEVKIPEMHVGSARDGQAIPIHQGDVEEEFVAHELRTKRGGTMKVLDDSESFVNELKPADPETIDKLFASNFDPTLLIVLRLSSLWAPQSATAPERVLYHYILRFMLSFCVIVCSWRVASSGYGGPAFHTYQNDVVFILLHVWLVVAFRSFRKLLHSAYFAEGVNVVCSQSIGQEYIRSVTRRIGIFGLISIVVVSGWILAAWVTQYVSPYYVDSPSATKNSFGIVGAVAFLVIVVPWVSCLISFGAIFHTLIEVLLREISVIHRNFRDTMSTYFNHSTSETEEWMSKKNSVLAAVIDPGITTASARYWNGDPHDSFHITHEKPADQSTTARKLVDRHERVNALLTMTVTGDPNQLDKLAQMRELLVGRVKVRLHRYDHAVKKKHSTQTKYISYLPRACTD
jgi:hypothetical protein